MVEGEVLRVEGESWDGLVSGYGGRGIEVVAEDGCAVFAEVYPDLVCASGFEEACDEGESLRVSVDGGEVCDGAFGGVESGGVFDALGGMPSVWGVEGAVVLEFGGETYRPVLPVDVVPGEHVGEGVVCAWGSGDEEESAGGGIESVDDARAHGVSDAGDGRVEAQEGVDEGVVGVSCARMDDEPGGLVDDEEVIVLVENVEFDAVLGFGRRFGVERRHRVGDAIAGRELLRGFGARLLVDLYGPGIDDALELRARPEGTLGGDGEIEPRGFQNGIGLKKRESVVEHAVRSL